MHTPRIAAVVVTYNRLPLLRRCLAALAACRAACPGAALDLWVIDNASTDGTGAAMAAWADPGLVYRSTGRNLVGAGGFAWGLRAARTRRPGGAAGGRPGPGRGVRVAVLPGAHP